MIKLQIQNLIRSFAREKLANHYSVSLDMVIDLSEDPRNIPGDFMLDGRTYSVKSSNPVSNEREKKNLIWDFDLRGNTWVNGRNVKSRMKDPESDYYILVGLVDDVPQKAFIVLGSHIPSSHIKISISGQSKYYEYAI